MKRKSLIIILLFALANNSIAQNTTASPLAGRWVNTQYEYFKSQSESEKILYSISPWLINIDSLGKCTIELLYEQRTEMGYPIDTKKEYGRLEYHYKKKCDIWLYTIKGNDSLLILGNGITPGAGVIFKKYKK